MARSAMRRDYGKVPRTDSPPRSQFNLTERHGTTGNAGYLIPFWWDYVYPNEVFNCKAVNVFTRITSPLDYPLFDGLTMTVHWFFDAVFRNAWDNGRKFLGERIDPADSIDYTIPVVGTVTNYDTSTGSNAFNDLCRYLGVPIRTAAQGGVNLSEISALPFRMYNRVYDYHYRPQQIIDSVTFTTGDGPDLAGTEYSLLKRAKRADYFTRNLPAPQRGDSVELGGKITTAASNAQFMGIYSDGESEYRRMDTSGGQLNVDSITTDAETNRMEVGTTVLELRNAVAMQQFLERDNRYGTRYGEILYSHYGSEFRDVRYAPVYLGGGRGNIDTTAIPNNSGSTGNLGDLAAIGTGGMRGAGFTYAVDEPGIIMGIVSIQGDLSYSQGLARKFSLSTRYDMFWPEFVAIGDQATEKREIWYGNNSVDSEVLGYNPRYEHMRTGINKFTQEFAVDHPTSLSNFHLSEDFSGPPSLNQTFIEDATPMDRVIQVTTQDQFLIDIYTEMYAARSLPLFGTPGLARL